MDFLIENKVSSASNIRDQLEKSSAHLVRLLSEVADQQSTWISHKGNENGLRLAAKFLPILDKYANGLFSTEAQSFKDL